MKLRISEARQLVYDVLMQTGFSSSASDKITKHILDTHLRGYTAAGLARVLAVRDRLGEKKPIEHVEIVNATPVLAHLDGHDTFGYLVGQEATEIAIEKAKQQGISIVAANNTWTTGMLAYYAEMAAAENLVTIITANSTPWVATHGGYTGVHGTNPICVGFPTSKVPVILDIATSKLLHADVVLSMRLGTELPAGTAFNEFGEETTNASEVFRGAIAPWGGHRGSGLAAMVQLFGILAGSPAFPPTLEKFGFSVIAIDPSKFRPLDEYKKEVDVYVSEIKKSPSINKNVDVCLPFERSEEQRRKALELDEIEVDDLIYYSLRGVLKE